MIHIMTDKMLNEAISKAKTEIFDEMRTAQKFERLEHQLFEIDTRLIKLEQKAFNDEVPTNRINTNV